MQFIESRADYAYFPAFAGIFMGNLFREEQQLPASHGTRLPTQRSMIVVATISCVAAIGATVWTVLTIIAGTGTLADALILASALFLGWRVAGRHETRRTVLGPATGAKSAVSFRCCSGAVRLLLPPPGVRREPVRDALLAGGPINRSLDQPWRPAFFWNGRNGEGCEGLRYVLCSAIFPGSWFTKLSEGS